MQRTQIILESWQYDTLKALSEQRGESLSFVVREAVGVYLAKSKADAELALDDIEGIGEDREATGREHDRFAYPTRKRGD